MKRPAGITITAVIDFVGCAFTFFGAGISVLSIALQPFIARVAGAPDPFAAAPGLKYIQMLTVLFMLALGVWGVATGIGLLRLREGARISQIVFAAFLTLIGIFTILLFLLIQLPVPQNDANPEMTRHVMQFTRVFIPLFYGALSAVGIGWLVYFNKRAIRDEFRSGAPAHVALPDGVPTSAARFEPVPGPMNVGRPVSISIIAALMLIRLVNFVLAPLLHFPVLFFGQFATGWNQLAVLVGFGVLQGAAGYGLLKLRMWGWTLAIIAELITIANLVATAFLPGSQAHFDELMQAVYERMALPSDIPMIHFPVAVLMLPAIPIVLVELYFIVTRRYAFVEAERKRAQTSA
ncbi:MAG: hypothetical protein WA823_15840 [Candidatus Acidiferrales bacterium]